MITIDSRPAKILQSNVLKDVGLYIIEIPTRSSIRTIDLQIGNVVEAKGETFLIVSVELYFQLLSPPIPILNLKCEKFTEGE